MKKIGKRILSTILAVATLMSCWVWMAPEQSAAAAANETLKDHYLFAYFTGTSLEGQKIHLAVSKDGYKYTALRDNAACIVPSKGVGNVRDPYIWYNEQDNHYYILATDLDFTDGGGDYSNNSQSFIIWRSKDLVNWYDETFIDVAAMSHLIGDTRGMNAVWAPQVLWDGESYVVYFTLRCNATSGFDIVYLRTSDLLDQNAYYEFGYLLGDSRGTDNGYDNIDADIIYNPGDGKYYLFYKTEDNSHRLGTSNKGTSLKTIHYYVGNTPTGPFTNPGDSKWPNCGFSIFPNYNVSLEGCNSFFDNDGNLVMYVDEFEHTNRITGEAEAYFHIAKTNGYDFTSWTYPDVSKHNINSLSPRHGSVVKITGEEYNRLLNNSYHIKSSSYSADETLENHLVAQFFTTGDVKYNAVIGQTNLNDSTNCEAGYDDVNGYYANFNGTNQYAEIDFDSLFHDGLNYQDGFTISFSALNVDRTGQFNNNEVNDRIYEIADVFGSRTGTEHYTHFSPGGGGNGSYIGNYNGPLNPSTDVGKHDWLDDMDGANRYDGKIHEYIISYATGNVMMYVDGKLVISKSRFTGDAKLDDSWYKALGSNSTMRIGRSGWDNDPYYLGAIKNFCVFDCSLSYYDVQYFNDKYETERGLASSDTYTGVNSVTPVFPRTEKGSVSSNYYSNVLYSSSLAGFAVPEGAGKNLNPAADAYENTMATAHSQGDAHFGLLYAHTTVLLLDGINDAKMPVMVDGRIEENNREATLSQVYPYGDKTSYPNKDFYMQDKWIGYSPRADYMENLGGTDYLGYNANTPISVAMDGSSGWGGSQGDRENRYFSGVMKVSDSVDYSNIGYYKLYNLIWMIKGTYEGSAFEATPASKNCDIYVIDFRPILKLRGEITETMYNDVMNNAELCPALRERYAAAVNEIRTLSPDNYSFSEGDDAAVTATKAFSKAIREAINTYNGVLEEIERQKTSGTYGHSVAEFGAREATCAVNGLTAGEYCVLCGEILKEQEVLATLPHTFGDPYTGEDGIKYTKCTVCGLKLEYKPSELRYENLFSFNNWADSTSCNVFSGTVTPDYGKGTITIVNKNTSEMYTRSTYDGQNLVATRDFTCYCIPVTGGKEYIVEATNVKESTSSGDVFVFQYNKDGLVYSVIPAVIGGIAPGNTNNAKFTVDSNAAYIELRFDANDAGKTITFSNIGVYELSDYNSFGTATESKRLAYYTGESEELQHPEPNAGYVFDGWYTKSGVKIENVNQLNTYSTIVYARWILSGFDVTYDNAFSVSEWSKSACNRLWYADDTTVSPTKRFAQTKGVSANAEDGTISVTYDQNVGSFARTNPWSDFETDERKLYTSTIIPNNEYVLEYTASSDDGASQNVCVYFYKDGKWTGKYKETGAETRGSMGTHTIVLPLGDFDGILLRFDNTNRSTESTVTFSDISIYPIEYQDHMNNITNRDYRRYYPQKMGFGDLFEYTPERAGYTFSTWMADLDGDSAYADDNYDCHNLKDTDLVEQSWHVYSTWTENTYNIKYVSNKAGVTDPSDVASRKYTDLVSMPNLTLKGYTFLGWTTTPDGTGSMLYTGGSQRNKLTGKNNDTVTLYGQWSANQYNLTFDNLIDFAEWKTLTPGNAKASDWTDTGFTLTSNSGAGEGTFSSPFFPVEPGKQYKVSFDYEESTIGTGDWDVYIFFCNESGGWVDFKDGPTNRYSSNGSTGVDPDNAVFTAPTNTSVVKAQIRVDANGSNTAVRFDNIRVYECKRNPIIYTDVQNKYVTYDSAYPSTAMKPLREGYDFQGWYYNNSDRYYDGSGNRTIDGVVDFIETRKLNSQWKLNNSALDDDTYVVDFGATAVFDPIANDTIFTNEAKNQNTGYEVSFGTNSEFTDADGKVKFAPAEIIRSAKSIAYNAYLDTDTNTKLNSTINVIPASNVLYEENVLGTSTTGKASWTNEGTAGTASQSDDQTERYGYDKMYVGAAGNHSNGSAKKTTVSSSNNRSETLTFTFTGTGFELYGACGNNTGVQVIAVRKGTELVKSAVIDTYYNDSSYGTLYQAPIYNVSGLPYGTYTVEVTAAYLPSISGAVNAPSTVVLVGDEESNKFDLIGALENVGLDYILEADDVDVEWFDDDSILNGGTGANDPTAFGTQSVTELVNYVDAVRVFEPLNEEDENTHYIDSEMNARYYNINDNLMSKSDFITGGKGFVYVEGNNNFGFDAEDYNSKGSKHEIYLTNASQGDNALVFSVANAGTYDRVMLSLRSATGGDIKVKIGGNELTVSSKTDMYYDITDYVQNGTVTVENMTADSLLAIGYLKLTGQAVLDTTSDLSSAIEMIETPLGGEEITSGSITNVEYTPSTDSHNSFNVTVNGRPTMIQFIEEDGGTRTYDRNNKNVVIKSYNADGVEVNSLDRTVAYEVWTINTNLTGPDVKVRAKYLNDGAYAWEKDCYSFTYEILEPVLDADVRSITPAAVSGKKGAVEVKVVTGPDAQGIRFVMPDGSTCTYYTAKAVTLENGDLEFTGKAWMNEDGLNTISVYIRENNVWNSVGTIEYTAE